MERVARVRAEIVRQKETALAIGDAGPACVRCTYFRSTARTCANPAYFKQDFDPVTGRYSNLVEVSAEQARSEDGLCGPEGLLFEEETILQGGYRRFMTAAGYTAAGAVIWALFDALVRNI